MNERIDPSPHMFDFSQEERKFDKNAGKQFVAM